MPSTIRRAKKQKKNKKLHRRIAGKCRLGFCIELHIDEGRLCLIALLPHIDILIKNHPLITVTNHLQETYMHNQIIKAAKFATYLAHFVHFFPD